MVDWTIGLLRGVQGSAGAVEEISRERRKQIAEHLKMQALADIESMHIDRRYGHERDIRAEDRQSREKISREQMQTQRDISELSNITSTNIAHERNEVLKQLQLDENQLRLDLSKASKGSEEARLKQAQIKASEKAILAYGKGEIDIDGVNTIREDAGLPPVEEYIKEEGREGIFGIGEKPEVTGIRRKEAGKGEDPASRVTAAGGMQSLLDELIEEGKNPASNRERGGMMTAEEGQPQEESDKPEYQRGILSSAAAEETTPTGDFGNLPPDPKTWQVERQMGDYYVLVDNEFQKMTPEQIEAWIKANEKPIDLEREKGLLKKSFRRVE